MNVLHNDRAHVDNQKTLQYMFRQFPSLSAHGHCIFGILQKDSRVEALLRRFAVKKKVNK